jgi:mannosyltransferase
VLRKDGSPPLYYLVLHVWTALFGTRETVTHELSLGLALLAIPAAYWAASVWGRLAGVAAAVLVAFTPFLDAHAVETRMYSLVALLALLAFGAFVRAFVERRRRFVVVFALLLAALLYTHNWSLYLALGAGVAVAVLALWRRDRSLLRDGALAGAGALALYAPWIPSLLYQAGHTGAPWSDVPGLDELEKIPYALIGTDSVIAVVVLVSLAGVVLARPADRRTIAVLAVALLASVVAAFAVAQEAPGWASRYFAVFLGPGVLLCALAIARARWLGAAALVAVALLAFDPATPSPYWKSNAEAVANQANPSLRPGDLVLSTQPEQIPLLRHYLVHGLGYADPMRRVPDPRVMDWREVTDRLRDATQPESVEPLLASVRPGARVLLVRPIVRGVEGWSAPWTRLVRIRSAEIADALAADPRFRALATYTGGTRVRSRFVGVVGVVYERRR